jgi:Uma2 family endonuclease
LSSMTLYAGEDISIPWAIQRRLSATEYERMVEAGIVSEDDRIELLEGVLVQKTPQNTPDSKVITRLNKLLVTMDRGAKAAIYAKAGVPEYWIVNTRERTIEVHTDPVARAGRYRTISTQTEGTLRARTVPGPKVVLSDLFAGCER